MKSKTSDMEKDQVNLDQLIFTLNWEDPRSDIRALKIKPGDTVMSITSGGCNTIEFLLQDPATIYSIDINPVQSWLMDLKLKAIQHLEYDEFKSLMGLSAQENAGKIYSQIADTLAPDSRLFWDHNLSVIKNGLTMSGKYEKFVKIAGKVLRIVQGKKIVEGVFEHTTLREQALYFDDHFDTRRFRLVFKLLFNKWMLAKRGLDADYFHFDDGSQSFAESFYKRAKKVLSDIPVNDNYFLALYLRGTYQTENSAPNYFKKENFRILKERIGRINVVTKDAKEWLKTMPDNTIDCFTLSNICELKSERDTASLFQEVTRVGKNQGRICFRNLMIPREVPSELRNLIQKDTELSDKLFSEDRSFVYGKVAAYTIRK